MPHYTKCELHAINLCTVKIKVIKHIVVLLSGLFRVVEFIMEDLYPVTENTIHFKKCNTVCLHLTSDGLSRMLFYICFLFIFISI